MADNVSIEDFQNELQMLLTSDPDNFATNIDKFDIDNLIDYWNISVQELYDKFKNFFSSDEADSTDMKRYDAATKNIDYVKPFVNRNGENYVEARSDEIKEVLENYDKMDFTSEDYKDAVNEIQKYITKLIMPQNRRYVEVEDLNRNFWVISNNLTALNDLTINFGNSFISQLIGELAGLWDNVYRIWQSIYYLNEQIDNAVKNEKLHISLRYDSIISPYVRAVTIGDRVVNYVVYNEYINSIIDKTQKELLDILTSKDNMIYIDYRTTKSLKLILRMLQDKNFVLISYGTVNQNTQWDLLSLSFTKEISGDVGATVNKAVKIRHLWVDFVSNDLSYGNIVSYTENNLGNQKSFLSYDCELTIPMLKNFECKYKDFVRFNKPYPSLQKVVYNSTILDRINSLNDSENWIGYEDSRTAVDGSYGYIDGFYGLDLEHYPLDDNININNYSTSFKLSENLFPIQFSSSDLISSQHDDSGQSKIANKHGNNVNNISVNLRYINGHNNAQEIELVTTKDMVGGTSQRFRRVISAQEVYLGGIYNNTPDGVDSPDDANYYLQFFLSKDYRTLSHTENIYNAPSNITEDDTNIFWVPISQVKDKQREQNGQANSIDVVKIWNNPTLRAAIVSKVKEDVGQWLKNYEYKVVNTCYSCFNYDATGSSGTHYSHLLLVYKEMDKVYVEEICPLDYSICFFGGSSMNDAAAEYSQENGDGVLWYSTNAYCPMIFKNGTYTYFSDSFLNLEGLSVEGGTSKVITINKMTIGVWGLDQACYTIWGKVSNKIWNIEGVLGTPLKEYSVTDSLDGLECDETSDVFYAGRVDENNYVHIERTNKKLYNSPTDYLSPWSNPKNGIGWKEWGYQPGA